MNALRLDSLEDEWGPAIPIHLPTEVDRESVVQSMAEQVRRILEAVIDPADGAGTAHCDPILTAGSTSEAQGEQAASDSVNKLGR